MTPNRLWTVDKAIVKTSEGEVTQSFDYGKDADGKFIVKEYDLSVKRSGVDISSVTQIYNEYSFVPLDETVFSPTPFGLEPPADEDR